MTDHGLTVSTAAAQSGDGVVDAPDSKGAGIAVYDLDENSPLNSDQARELAAALLEAAADVDGWVMR